MKTSLSRMVAGFVAIMAATTPAAAGWEEELRQDARIELGCEVAFLLNVVVRTVDGRTVVNVQVHCEDKRAFEAKQEGEGRPFSFKACVDPKARAC